MKKKNNKKEVGKMKKVVLSIFLLVSVLVLAVFLGACGGYDPKPMYNKTFEYTGAAMSIPWDEIHNRCYTDEKDLKMDKREVLEKYFGQIDWAATKERFESYGLPPIEITDDATKSVDAFISFMNTAVEKIYSNVKGLKFSIGGEADEVDVTITYPDGQSQTVNTVNGGTQDPKEFRGITFTKEGANGTEISLSLTRTGDKGVAFIVTLYDEFTQEHIGGTVSTFLSYTLMGSNDTALMDIDVYPAYTEKTNA